MRGRGAGPRAPRASHSDAKLLGRRVREGGREGAPPPPPVADARLHAPRGAPPKGASLTGKGDARASRTTSGGGAGTAQTPPPARHAHTNCAWMTGPSRHGNWREATRRWARAVAAHKTIEPPSFLECASRGGSARAGGAATSRRPQDEARSHGGSQPRNQRRHKRGREARGGRSTKVHPLAAPAKAGGPPGVLPTHHRAV